MHCFALLNFFNCLSMKTFEMTVLWNISVHDIGMKSQAENYIKPHDALYHFTPRSTGLPQLQIIFFFQMIDLAI